MNVGGLCCLCSAGFSSIFVYRYIFGDDGKNVFWYSLLGVY